MALPESAPTVTCTLSRPLHAEGTSGAITSAHLQIDRGLVWAASGETLYPEPVPVVVSELDGGLSFEVIPVDAAGVMDLAGNMVNFWTYSLRITVSLSENQTKVVTYNFQPLLGSDLDLDLVAHDGAVSNPPVTTSGEGVTIIIGGAEFDVLSGGTP